MKMHFKELIQILIRRLCHHCEFVTCDGDGDMVVF